MLGEQPPVTAGAGDEQDDNLDLTVSTLEGDAAIKRLDVRQPNLGLDRDDRCPQPDLGVPGAQIPLDW